MRPNPRLNALPQQFLRVAAIAMLRRDDGWMGVRRRVDGRVWAGASAAAEPGRITVVGGHQRARHVVDRWVGRARSRDRARPGAAPPGDTDRDERIVACDRVRDRTTQLAGG